MASFTLPMRAHITTLRNFRGIPQEYSRASGTKYVSAGARHTSRSLNESLSREVCCYAASQQTSANTDEEYNKAFKRVYERETPLISHLLEEIDKLTTIQDAVEETTGEEYTPQERREAVRRVVDRYFDQFTEGLVMVLAGYAQASYGEGHVRVAETLVMLREEILARSLSQLPPEMRALEHLIGMFNSTSQERTEATKALGRDGTAGIPQADMAALRTTASQMLEDMEEKRDIVDSTLLARLCIVREELDEAAAEMGLLVEDSTYYDLMSATWRLLPMGPAAFVKELIHVASPEKRKALLSACIVDDFGGEKADATSLQWRKEGVRPGRLMNTITALLSGLRKEGLSPSSNEVVRLQEVKAEALKLLYRLAAG